MPNTMENTVTTVTNATTSTINNSNIEEEANMENEKKTCYLCGVVIEEGEGFKDENGNYICDECMEMEGAFICPECGTWAYDSEAVTVNEGYHNELVVCSTCANDNYYYCENCHGVFSHSHVRFTHSGDFVCDSCFDDYYRECGNCGEVYERDDMEWDDDNEEYYCPHCVNNMGIRGYNYKPDPEFHEAESDRNTPAKDLLFMGVELECDNGNYEPNHVAKEILRECNTMDGNLFYFKHDGSLDEGMELVTHPCTLSYHTTEFPWEKVCKIELEHGFKSHDAETCGLHVHVNRDFFGKEPEHSMNVGKLCLLVSEFWNNIFKFSRRTERQLNWCAKYGSFVDEGDENDEEKIAKGVYDKYPKGSHSNRYYAINLTNRNTVEFRIFRGSLKPDTIKATLQFVSNISHFAKEKSPKEILNCKWSDIIGYHHYAELDAYCAERGICDCTAEKLPVQKKPKFKRGDIVRMNPDFTTSPYHYAVAERFRILAGEEFTVTEVFLRNWNDASENGLYVHGVSLDWANKEHPVLTNRWGEETPIGDYVWDENYLTLVRHGDE